MNINKYTVLFALLGCLSEASAMHSKEDLTDDDVTYFNKRRVAMENFTPNGECQSPAENYFNLVIELQELCEIWPEDEILKQNYGRLLQLCTSSNDRDLKEKCARLLVEKKGNLLESEYTMLEHLNDISLVRELLKIYPKNKHINLNLKDLLLQQKQTLEGLNVVSRIILRDPSDQPLTESYMKLLTSVKLGDIALETYLNDIDLCISNPQEYQQQKKIVKKNIKDVNKTITNSLLETCQVLFGILKQLPTNDIYEATLCVILNTLIAHDHNNTADTLIGRLYLNDNNYSLFLKERYAFLRIKEKKYEPALALYESIFEDESFNPDLYEAAKYYNSLGNLYCILNKNKEAITAFRKALDLDKDNLFLLKNLAYVESYDNNHEEALQIFQKILSREDLEEVYPQIGKEINKHYITILQNAGHYEEALNILKKQQEEAINKHLRKIKFIKEDISLKTRKEEERKNQSEKPQTKRKMPPQTKKPYEYTVQTTNTNSLKIPSMPSQKKVKTRKNPEEQNMSSLKIAQKKRNTPKPSISTPQKSTYVTIESLLRGKPLKTFDDLFQNFRTGYFSDISMKSTLALFKSLSQSCIPAKGSHKKVKFNPKDFSINNKERMSILSNKTVLLDDQIRDLQKKFLSCGLYPSDLYDILKEKKLIND